MWSDIERTNISSDINLHLDNYKRGLIFYDAYRMYLESLSKPYLNTYF